MHAQNATSEHHSGPHVSSLPTLFAVFFSLMILTILTVTIRQVDLGEWNLFAAMVIATIKASMVALWFMHLKYDTGFNRLVFLGSFLFVALFIGIVMIDTGAYQADLDWVEKVQQPAATH